VINLTEEIPKEGRVNKSPFSKQKRDIKKFQNGFSLFWLSDSRNKILSNPQNLKPSTIETEYTDIFSKRSIDKTTISAHNDARCLFEI